MQRPNLRPLGLVIAALAGLILAAACSPPTRGQEASTPPARYQDSAIAATIFTDTDAITAACGGAAHEAGVSVIACTRSAGIDGVQDVYLPNPCQWPGADPYAQLACHELGHVNGWPASHPTQ